MNTNKYISYTTSFNNRVTKLSDDLRKNIDTNKIQQNIATLETITGGTCKLNNDSIMHYFQKLDPAVKRAFGHAHITSRHVIKKCYSANQHALIQAAIIQDRAKFLLKKLKQLTEPLDRSEKTLEESKETLNNNINTRTTNNENLLRLGSHLIRNILFMLRSSTDTQYYALKDQYYALNDQFNTMLVATEVDTQWTNDVKNALLELENDLLELEDESENEQSDFEEEFATERNDNNQTKSATLNPDTAQGFNHET